jgi:hypothetical protein
MAKTKKQKRKQRTVLFIWAAVVAMSAFLYMAKDHPDFISARKWVFQKIFEFPAVQKANQENSIKSTQFNYGDEIDRLAKEYGLSATYLKSLVVLECSGRKPVKPRFEKHVFRKLQKVRDGKRKQFERITKKDLHDASDEALKNLASSWGPFQLMGYKCLQLEVKVSDIRGEDALDWGVRWIHMEYGHLLKRNKYKDAFHYHNTGRAFPSDGKTLPVLWQWKASLYLFLFNK